MSRQTRPWLAGLLRVAAIVLGLNLIFYVLQHLFGWPTGVRTVGGAVLFVLGGFMMGGGASRQSVGNLAETGHLGKDGVQRYVTDRMRSENAGLLVCLLGSATFGLALLFP